MFRKIASVILIAFFSLTLFAQNAFDKDGLRTGPWKAYYPDTTLRYEATFSKGKPVGLMKRYDEEGRHAINMSFYSNGDRCFVEMFSKNGKIEAQGVYEAQKKDSTWVYLGTDGSLRMIENYDHGVLSGKTESYYPTAGISRIVNYTNGIKNGPWLQFFQNGDTMMTASYEDDLLHGEYLSFFPEGKIQIEGRYYKDLKDGDWLYYSEEGDTLTVLQYNKGEILNPEVLEESYEKFIKNVEENIGNFPDPAVEGGL